MSTELYRATSSIRKRPPPWDPRRTLGIGPRESFRERRAFMGEVPLYISLFGQSSLVSPGALERKF